MSLKRKKILVTGVAGFLGSHLSEKLVELGHEVVGIDNMIGGYDDNVPKNIEFHKVDCCDFEKVKFIMKDINVVYFSDSNDKKTFPDEVKGFLTNYYSFAKRYKYFPDIEASYVTLA